MHTPGAGLLGGAGADGLIKPEEDEADGPDLPMASPTWDPPLANPNWLLMCVATSAALLLREDCRAWLVTPIAVRSLFRTGSAVASW